MITDQTDIRATLEVLERQKAILPFRSDKAACTAPDVMIHVFAKNVGETYRLLEEELARLPKRALAGCDCMVMGPTTMGELSRIDRLLPRTDRFRRGVGASAIYSGGVEVFLFCQYQ